MTTLLFKALSDAGSQLLLCEPHLIRLGYPDFLLPDFRSVPLALSTIRAIARLHGLTGASTAAADGGEISFSRLISLVDDLGSVASTTGGDIVGRQCVAGSGRSWRIAAAQRRVNSLPFVKSKPKR